MQYSGGPNHTMLCNNAAHISACVFAPVSSVFFLIAVFLLIGVFRVDSCLPLPFSRLPYFWRMIGACTKSKVSPLLSVLLVSSVCALIPKCTSHEFLLDVSSEM